MLFLESWQVHPSYWMYLVICSSLTVLGTYLTFIAYRLIALPNKVFLLQRSEKTPLWGIGIVGGIVGSLSTIFQMFALHAGEHVAYVLAIKQLSVIIAILVNVRFLKERSNPQRFWGAVIITIGAIIVGFSN